MDYEWFLGQFEALTGIQLHLYKDKQMRRRIGALIEREGLKDYHELMSLLVADEKERSFFIDYLTINVTEFFRTPEHWDSFVNNVLRKLGQKKKGPLRIWCCACSTGEEPCGLSISMLEIDKNAEFQIIASDLDVNVLAKAKKGCFDERNMGNVSPMTLWRYFEETKEGWLANKEVMNHIEFMNLDLLKDPYPTGCDIIVCRNVLIYFNEEAKDIIFEKFFNSLVPGGFLFTGNAEQIIYFKKYGYQKTTNYLYKKPE